MMITWQSVVDILVLTSALYVLMRWAQGARALRLAFALIAFYAAALVARHLGLIMTSWVLTAATLASVALLIILFQPEVRNALMRLDAVLRIGLNPLSGAAPPFREVAEAAFAMGARYTGALIVITRRDAIDEIVSGGVPFGAQPSRPVLEAIFQKQSPLHDGAAVIDGRQIKRLGVLLPLTEREDVPPEYGTRHRAAMGLAERTDAIVITVSEQRGVVTVMHGRSVTAARDAQHLVTLLERSHAVARTTWKTRLLRTFTGHPRYKLAALGLATFIWWVSLMGPRTSVRTINVPIEFRNVGAGMAILEQSPDRIEVQLRGSRVSLDALETADLVARFDLKNAREGRHVLHVGATNLNTPAGVSVDRVQPDTLVVQLGKRGS